MRDLPYFFVLASIIGGFALGVILMVIISKLGLNRDQQKAKLILDEANIKADAALRQAQLDAKTQAYDLKLVDNFSKQRVSVKQVLIRYTTTLIAVVSIFLLFVPFFNKNKKTFQDILSNTIIINDK